MIEAWRADAECLRRGLHWSDFVDDDPTPAAVEACGACPVKPQCLEAAILHDESGYWAGTSERERRRYAARQRRLLSVEATRSDDGAAPWRACPVCGEAGTFIERRDELVCSTCDAMFPLGAIR